MPADMPSPSLDAIPRVGTAAALRQLAALLRPHRAAFAAASALLVVATAGQLAGPLLLRRAVDVDLAGRNPRGLVLTVTAYAIVLGVVLALRYLLRVRLETIGQAVILDLRRRLFRHVLRQSMSFHDQVPPGRLIARIQSDTDALRQALSSTAVTLVEAALLGAGTLAVLVVVAPSLALAVLAIVVVAGLVAWRLAAGGMRRFVVVREKTARVTGHLAEHVQGIGTIQAFGREDEALSALDDLNRDRFIAALRANVFFTLVHRSAAVVEVVGLSVALALGSRQVAAGALTLGALVMTIDYLRRIFAPVQHLAEQLEVVQRAAASASRVFGLLSLPPRVRDPSDPERWPGFEDAIELRDAWFSYRDDGEHALRGVSFRLPRGQTWAVVGATGSGKTSLVNLLLRFYDPQRGQVLVDGRDVRTIPQVDLRRHFALVVQDVHVFPGSVLSNIAPDGIVRDDAHRAELREAARWAGASAFVERLPRGFDEPILERGANLSAGERQLLALARALARNPDILLLDEATASVDPESERRVQASLGRLLAGRTALVIAHRLSTVRHADRILVLERGRIVEEGRHEELLKLGGTYAALHAMQFRPARGDEEAS